MPRVDRQAEQAGYFAFLTPDHPRSQDRGTSAARSPARMEREHKGDTMNLHNKGTDRLLASIGVEPEGTPRHDQWGKPIAVEYRTVKSLHDHGWSDTDRPTIRGRDLLEIRAIYGEDRNKPRAYRVSLIGRPDDIELPGDHKVRMGPAPLAILGPGGAFVREVMP